MFNFPAEGFAWEDLHEFFNECQRMVKVPNAVEILPKIWTAWVGRTNVTDRQTDDRRQTDGQAIAYSERELTFTFAKTTANRGIWPALISLHRSEPNLARESGPIVHFSMSMQSVYIIIYNHMLTTKVWPILEFFGRGSWTHLRFAHQGSSLACEPVIFCWSKRK